MASPILCILGTGNMGRAIALGALDQRILAPNQLLIVEPDTSRHAPLAARQLLCLSSARDLLPHLNSPDMQLLLAVKPQSLADLARDLTASNLNLDRVVISILAGATSEKIRAALGGRPRIIRVMPNTPAQIGQGTTGIALGAGSRPGDEALALRLFRALGPVVEIIDESLMDAMTAVAASGPAYLFYVAEAMIAASENLGFDRALARRIVAQTLAGAAALLTNSTDDPAALRAAVTSKGGTTEAALRILEEARVKDAFLRALTAARDRGHELSK